MKIKTTCPICKKVHYVEVNAVHFGLWVDENVPIQVAMPELSPEDREMLLSGICPECWDKMWSEEEDEDPECDCEWVEEDDFEEELFTDLETVIDFLLGL